MDLKRNISLPHREQYFPMANSCHNFMRLLAKLGIVDIDNGIKPNGSINGKLIGDIDNLVFRLLS